MSSAQPQKQPPELALSDAEHQALQRYAQAHGMTLEQAANHAVSQQLQARYVPRKRFNNVVRIR